MADRPQPELIASGTLSKTPFGHLLVYLDQHRLSGTLAVWPEKTSEKQQGQDRILFRLGRPIAARLVEPASALDQGLIPLFERRNAPYSFYNGDLLGPSEGRLESQIDPFALIMQSLRESMRNDVVQAVLTPLHGARLRVQPTVQFERYRFSPSEMGLVELLLAEPTDVETLVADSGLDPLLGRNIVYLLLITRAVTLYDESRENQAEATRMRRSSKVTHPEIHAPPEIDTDHQHSPKPSRSNRPSPLPRSSSPSQPAAKRRESSRELLLKTIPPPPADLDAETRHRWEEIRELAEKIDELNYFEMLNVESNTAPNEIRSAFFALAKKWHPDRLPEALLPLKPQVDMVFGYLSQAHQCLSNEEERLKYIRSVKEGGGTPASDRLMQKVLDGAMAYQRVEVLARKHEYDKALELLERVISLSGDEADYHAMQAWLLLQKHPEGDAPFKEMINATEKALKLNKDHERSIYYRGLILKRMKRDADALKFFRRAAELNPKNLDALREVRIATMRKGEKNGTQKGLFAGFFKKK